MTSDDPNFSKGEQVFLSIVEVSKPLANSGKGKIFISTNHNTLAWGQSFATVEDAIKSLDILFGDNLGFKKLI